MPKHVKKSSKPVAKHIEPKVKRTTSRAAELSAERKEKSVLQEGVRGIFMILVIFAVVGYAIVYFLSNKPAIHNVCNQTKQYIVDHPSELKSLLVASFDEASKCPENAPECIQKNLQNISTFFPDDGKLPNHTSTYFIRAESEDYISKLFLSGRYQKDQADTMKEKEVLEVLKGKRTDICASGFKTDVNFTTMTYLKDFIVEAEIIEPVTDHGKIIGAVVRLFGD